MSNSDFEQIVVGMTFEDVAELFGEEGDFVSGHDAQIEPGIPVGAMNTEIREWQCADGSTVRIMFGAGKVREKSRTGT